MQDAALQQTRNKKRQLPPLSGISVRSLEECMARLEDLAENCVSNIIPFALLKYGPEVQRDRQHHCCRCTCRGQVLVFRRLQ